MNRVAAVELWDRACEALRAKLHPDVFSRWIGVIQPVEFEENKLTLAVDNDFYQTWLEENYVPLISQAITAITGTDVRISFTVKPEAGAGFAPAAAPEPVPAPSRPKTVSERLARRSQPRPQLNPKFIFDTFVIGSSNSFAHAASLAVAQAPARAYNPLFIYGETGLGKTHLMQAIGHHVLNTATATVCYVSSETLLNEYIDAVQNRTLVQFRKRYRSTDLLLIDDIHFLAGKERIQEEFFHTFNSLFDAHKQIVMTSDRPANEITGLEKRLVSRFEWGLVTELEPPDLETRVAILKHKQAYAQVTLPDDLLFFIAENIRANIRSLEGALVRAISYSALTGQQLTMEALKNLLRDSIDKEKQSEVTFDSIQRAVAEHYDIRLADMSSKRRPRSVAQPRQVAMYLCRRLTRSSLPEIANAFGKSHATVLHAYRTVDKRMDNDNLVKEDVFSISEKLGKKLG